MGNYLDIDDPAELAPIVKISQLQKNVLFTLVDYLKSGNALFFVDTYDYEQLDSLIRLAYEHLKWADDYGNVREYIPGVGGFDSDKKTWISSPVERIHAGSENTFYTFYDFLFCHGFNDHTTIVIKGANRFLESCPESINWIRLALENNFYGSRQKLTFILADVGIDVPVDLVPYAIKFKLCAPCRERILELIREELPKWWDADHWKGAKESDAAEEIADFLAGFSEMEIRQTLRYASAYGDGLYVKEVRDRVRTAKKKMVERVGMLKLISPSDVDFAGLTNLRKYLVNVGKILAEKRTLKIMGRPIPKGILLVGMPGCGKSLCAKTAQGILNRPLIQLDVGRLLGKYVGESERNLRIALDVAERASPCILWIDELEKAFSGMDSSDGVALRLFGSFLTWLQENNSDVYVIATANNIDKIPDEFKRRGRFDEIFRVMMPSQKERADIFKFHLREIQDRGLLFCSGDEVAFDQLCAKLSELTWDGVADGYSGADISAIVTNAVWNMIASGAECLTRNMIELAMCNIKPLRCVMGDRYDYFVKKLKSSGYEPASEEG